MFITIFILAFIISGVVCHFIARKKGKSPVFWGAMGFFFGPLAIPFVLFVKPQNTD